MPGAVSSSLCMAGRSPEGLEGLEKFLLALLPQAGPGFTQRLGHKHRFLQIWKFWERFYAECGRLVAAVFLENSCSCPGSS